VSKPYTVSWFSAGVSSAVATRLAIAEIDEVIYCHIDDQHADTLRFVADCEQWFGKPIKILQSPAKCVENAMRLFPSKGFGKWSPCTQILKRRVRQEWERANSHRSPIRYVWGMDATEADRAKSVCRAMPTFDHIFPLIDRKIAKAEAHEILRASGIARPAMYELGYRNNNCVGCVKGGKGYWNKIRVDFPEVFESRAKLERLIGGSILKTSVGKGEKSEPLYLDELDPTAGRDDGPIVDDCGIMCQIMAIREAGL
jgi:hypothetical protein